MNPEIATLQRELVYYQIKAQECTDVIKQLTGYTPENFTISFSVSKQPILSFDVGVQEMNFAVGIFMSWHSYYTQRIREHQQVLRALQAAPSDNCAV